MTILPNIHQDGTSDAIPVAHARADRLHSARVADARIVDGRPFSAPRFPNLPPTSQTQIPPAAVLPQLPRPYTQRPVQRQSGLRLLPLDGFVWGERHHQQPKPRTRGDHVLLWVTDGTMRVDLPRAHYTLRAGDVHFLPAGTAFASLPLPGARGMALLLAPDLARDCEPALPDRMVAGGIGTDAQDLMNLLIQLSREGAADSRQARAAISCQLGLLSITLQRLSPATERPASVPNGPTDLTLVQRFIALAEAELGHGRTVADLAEDLGTTSAALDRACLAARGRRAIQLMHDLRHEQAVRALRQSTRPLDLIARDLGYTSLAHFNRAFVAATGRLPAMFRINEGMGESVAPSA